MPLAHPLGPPVNLGFPLGLLAAPALIVEETMAKTITRWLISDLSGERVLESEGTALSFQLDGTSYVIDLTRREANLLRAKLGPFTNGARKAQKAREREQVLAVQRKRLARKQAERKRLEQKQAAEEAMEPVKLTPPAPVAARVEEPAAPAPAKRDESRDWPQPAAETLFEDSPPTVSVSSPSIAQTPFSPRVNEVEALDDSPVEHTPIDAMPDYENEGEDMESPVAPLATNLFQAPPAIARGARPDVTLKRVPADPQTVRVWAQHHGIRVPQRGRIPDEVMNAFERNQSERQSNVALPGGTRQETPKRAPAPALDPETLFAAPNV